MTTKQKALYNALQEIQEIDARARLDKARKAELKEWVVKELFPKPKEGTNKMEVADIQLDYKYTIDRIVDNVVFQNVYDQLLKYKVPVDDLVLWKPTLATKPYRNLTLQQLKIVDTFVTAKPGSSTLTIISQNE